MANRPPPVRLIPFAAAEGLYGVLVYTIAILGGLAVLLFLSESNWPWGIFSLLFYVLLIFAFLRYAESKRRSLDGFVISFSRINTTIVCDVFVQTLRVALFSVLIDLFGNQKLGLLFNVGNVSGYQVRLLLVVFLLTIFLFFPLLYGYLVQTSDEIEQYKARSAATRR
jgi:hypothetical protein